MYVRTCIIINTPRTPVYEFYETKGRPFHSHKSIQVKYSAYDQPVTASPVVLTAHNVRLTQYLESSWQVLLYNYCATLTRALTSGLVAGGTRGIRGARS